MSEAEKLDAIKQILGNSAYCLGVLIELVDPRHLSKQQKTRLNYVTKLVNDTIMEIDKLKLDGE